MINFKITVPATSANIGPGYDIWGLAVNLYNEFEITAPEVSNELEIKPAWDLKFEYNDLVKKTSGSSTLTLPIDSSSLIKKSYSYIFQKASLDDYPVSVKVKVGIPLERGLGSSSTAIIGGLMAANEILRRIYAINYSIEEIFQFACEIEGHPDNIAPAIYGGLTSAVKSEVSQDYLPAKLEFKPPLNIMGIIPHISLSTKKARESVPKKVELQDLIFHSSRCVMLTHLFSKATWEVQDYNLLIESLQDKVHQDQRAKHIPGMLETFDLWKKTGCLGGYLSGAGTTLLGFWHKGINMEVITLNQVFIDNGIGATVIKLEANFSGTFLES